MNEATHPIIELRDISLSYDHYQVLQGVNFSVKQGEIFIIMGGTGSGKSTILKSMIGLLPPAKGEILYDGVSFWEIEPFEQDRIMRRFGILYQSGALWSSMTLAENIALPLEQNTDLGSDEIRDIVALKLSLVGLEGFENFYPSEISGGMRKRAGLARALALDPDILFFDEHSTGLDPISAYHLDELILQLRDSLGTTVVVVTHDLESIFAIGTNSILLDAESKTIIASGNPKNLLNESKDPRVVAFLSRSKKILKPGVRND
jgi:phospholipid/cholesterol/gamma-HCH transport system ATP-binding protein